jgi:diguanylate cyclase (GGDEF)-like protein
MDKAAWRASLLPALVWAALTLATAGIIGIALHRMHAARVEAAFSEAEATAATAEQVILRAFELVGSIHELLGIKAGLLDDGNSTASLALDNHLRGLARNGRFGLVQLSIVDIAGIIAWSSTTAATGVPVPDLEAFRTHAAGENYGVYIGAPRIGRVSGRWSIIVTKTIFGEDVVPIGVGVVALDPIGLSVSLGELARRTKRRITVRRLSDGAMLARSVDIEKHLTRPPEPNHPLVVTARQAPNGRSNYESVLSRRETISAYRSSQSLPVVIAAVFDSEEELQSFWHLAYAAILCGLAVLALELHLARVWVRRRRLHDLLVAQAEQDPLTSLRNRRSLEGQASLVLAEATRIAEPVAVLLFDLDHFKQVNDTFGHDVGDTVLRDVAAAITRNVRPEDLVCRWGGEEILVLFRHCDRAGSLARAEGLRSAIAGLYADGHGPVPGVTTSIGGAVFPYGGKTLSELVHTADEALYEAKRQGRNRVVIGGMSKATSLAA